MMQEDLKISSGRGELHLNSGHECVYISVTVLGAGYTMILSPEKIDKLIDALERLRRDVSS
jgi:hypothetical protein